MTNSIVKQFNVTSASQSLVLLLKSKDATIS
ncbi:hypothetical protein C5L25_001105 [Secundilactobacillus silagei JCM 19001]|uniref:Uncharacterized protein n=1 Tax=Secundilactobacillus silagei JCM 19001 TaxID=1302250 RepID=A0A1Z5IK47_9LACO|nr:hypothetical protein C5L25_001105 [Secundilactobacillus silagei JCM 19001]GAX01952.1 hypothetical protein IWT126_02016 [Secundilactobacillus silagei JCM 19001]